MGLYDIVTQVQAQSATAGIHNSPQNIIKLDLLYQKN
jgi:hypothetical protein